MKAGAWARVTATMGGAILLASSATANGIYRNGFGAQSMAMGGADVAWARDPLSALALNPAGLSYVTQPEWNLSTLAGLAQGRFERPPDSSGSLSQSLQAAPESAFALPLPRWPVHLGFSVSADSALSADWNYTDPPGGLGGATSYGQQRHLAEILLLRTAVGASVRVHRQVSLGVSVGLLYNRNRLNSPFIFQSQPALQGAKTLLDLQTDGFGWDTRAGVLYQPLTNLQFGFAYRTAPRVESDGSATGDVGRQLGLASLPFRYDATVVTRFPDQFSLGASWQADPRWRLAVGVDYIRWGDAFDTLEVRLRNGTSPELNGLVGSDALVDRIPQRWSDQWVYRAGIELAVTDRWTLRAGYAFAHSPVPEATLTPLTAALMEHTLTAGVGYQQGRYRIEAAYQYDLPATGRVGQSALHSGEYSGSRTTVQVHQWALTFRLGF
jgi:long-chain fatty acid transport protein